MAERSNATSKKNLDAAQDVSTLQKRGRRRLVGAIALVLLAVIILPMVFDPEPRQDAPAVSIRIPNEESGKFTPKSAPKPAAPQSEQAASALSTDPVPATKSAPAAAPPPLAKPEAKPDPRAATRVVDKPAPKPAEKPVAKAEPKAADKSVPPPAPKAVENPPASAGGEQFVVQVGAFADPLKVKERVQQIKEAKLPHYTEPVATANGTVTRIRLGPYPSKEAAEKAHDRAKALGLSPANPVAK